MGLTNDRHPFDRLFVATVLPYKENSCEIDEEAYRKLLRYFLQPKFVDAGGAIIVNPEAGEMFYLSREEKRRTLEIAMEECGGKVPVFVGVLGLTTRETIEEAKDAQSMKVDGLFLLPPIGSLDITGAWNAEKYPEVWIDMAKDVLRGVDLPVITHPVASYTPKFGIGLPLSATLKMLDEIPQIIGWKMVYNYEGFRTVAWALRNYKRHVGILGANAVFFHEALANDLLDGTLTGSLSYAMEPMVDHIQAWRNKDIDTARKIWNGGLMQLQEYVYSDYSRLHNRYKIAAWLRGLVPHPFMRPPLPKPFEEEVVQLKQLLQNCGLDVIPDDRIRETFHQFSAAI